MLHDGIDPIEYKKEQRTARRLEEAKSITFAKSAEEYFEAHQRKWKNAKHRAQFTNTLRDYVLPKIGKLAVADIDTGLVLKCIEPIWHEKTVTASRVRNRIEAGLDWDQVHEYRNGENPARWNGHLENLLPSPSELMEAKHHAASPYAEVATFMAELDQQQSVAARVLEFLILTAARLGEVTGATWDEINLTEKTWTVPAARMKTRKEHKVPLSDRAIELLRSLPQ